MPLAAGDRGDRTAEKQRITASNFIRLLNTAELNYFHVHGRYATTAELIKSEEWEQTIKASREDLGPLQTVSPQPDSEPLTGFHFRFLVTSDRSEYEVSLTPTTAKCGLRLFSDESGILYEGRVLGCTARTGISTTPSWAPPNVDEVVPPTRRDTVCPLPKVLQEASRRVEALAANLQRFSAREQIEHIEVRKNGHIRTVDKSTFNYVAQIDQQAGAPSVEEYRTGTKPEVSSEIQLYDTGSAAFALVFHPLYIGNYAMSCEGLTDSEARPAWQVHFAQRPDRSNQFHVLRLENKYFPLNLNGRAWIAADNYEVLRLETDLQEPMKQISLEREHLAIDYGPVEFRKRGVRLWLPQLADLYIEYHGHRYERRHKFSDFQLFWVETGEQVKEPQSTKESYSQNN